MMSLSSKTFSRYNNIRSIKDDIVWPLQRCSSCQLSCYVQSYFTWSINNISAIKIKSLTTRGRGLQMTLINDKFVRKRVVKLTMSYFPIWQITCLKEQFLGKIQYKYIGLEAGSRKISVSQQNVKTYIR